MIHRSAALMVVAAAMAFGFETRLAQAATPITIDRTSVAFGHINVGYTSAAKTVTLTNSDPIIAFGPIKFFGGEPPSAEFSASQNCQGVTLRAGESCRISYTFSPSGPGA